MKTEQWLIGPQIVGAVYLLISLIQLWFPPRKINSFYGYRSPAAMENQQSWEVANRYATPLMLTMGLLLIVVGLLTTYLLNLMKGGDVKSAITFMILIVSAMGSALVLITKTEKRLENFNKSIQ